MTDPVPPYAPADHHIQVIAPERLAPSHGYSQVVVGNGRLMVVSGQISIDGSGGLVGPGDAREQAHQVFENLDICLTAAGGSFADVVKLTYYVTDLRAMAAVGAALRDHVDPAQLPASTAVQVVALLHPEALIEVEAMALLR
jgi:enamine deaminase RidA (YjgF/YER057c/UK114 family)